MPEYLCYNGPIGNGDKHNHLKVKVGVSGALDSVKCGTQALDVAKEVGREIIRQGGILVTEATTGFPLWAAMGAKEEKGVTFGISPAANEQEHVTAYRLPLDYLDLIVYTGFGYSGADLLFTRSCDAIIIGCGEVRSIAEFAVALEEGRPVGVLEGSWETDEAIRSVLATGRAMPQNVIFDTDPKRLVTKILQAVAARKVAEFKLTKK